MNWFYRNFVFPIKEEYYKHKKRHYKCTVCGLYEAPYFYPNNYAFSLTDSYGWHKLEDGRWVCHHCIDHPAFNIESWEWWHDFVENHNALFLNHIKEVDEEYYKEYFDEN